MKKIVIASANEHKISELKKMLSPLNIKVVSYKDILKDDFEIEETGKTFAENAKLKAETIAAKTKLPTIADDSGLCIKALNGEPGLYSARYANGLGGYENAWNEINERLKSKNDRDAYFICVIALAIPDSSTKIFEGRCNGFITFPPRGDKGFGYDPIFVPNGMGATFAEMSDEEKNSISHRAFAMEKFVKYLEEQEKKSAQTPKSKSKGDGNNTSKSQPEKVENAENVNPAQPSKQRVKKKSQPSNPMEEFIDVDVKLDTNENS